jgi:hypothetical protein
MTIKSTNIGLGPQIADGATGNSSVFRTEGCASGTVALTSSHAGTLSVQRFVDEGGVVHAAHRGRGGQYPYCGRLVRRASVRLHRRELRE